MTWIQTYKGGVFDFVNPVGIEMDIEEIAHALSMICRFTGHVREFYSVAQHCTIVSDLSPSVYAFTGLMHDATEAYVGDVAKPLKNMLPAYEVIEDRVAREIATRFGVIHPLPKQVKKADSLALMWERRDLMEEPPAPWMEESLLALVPKETLVPLGPADAERLFINYYQFYSSTPNRK